MSSQKSSRRNSVAGSLENAPMSVMSGDDRNTSLLSQGERETNGEIVISEETTSFTQALKDSTRIAALAVLGTFFHPMYSIVNNIVLGHFEDETPLAGLGLGALTIGITALSIGICFAFGAATFMAQEFGRKNMRSIHVYMNRSLFLNTVVFCILMIPTFFIKQIYQAIGQDEEVAAYGAQYVHTIMPFLWFELTNWSYMQFCTSQRYMLVSPICIISGALVHSMMIGILVYGLDWGFTGVCWATASVFVGRTIACQIYLRCNKNLQWFDDVKLFSRETVSNLGPMVKICVQSMFMGVWGWWAFDIFTFMATYLGESEAAAQSIMRSLGLLTFMLPVGYSSAVTILTGNAIGLSKPKLAMQYYKVCMFMACIITALQMTVLWLARDSLVKMYTNHANISNIIVHAWPILILFTLFDTTQAMGQSVIRGTGKQGVGAIITGTAYFIVGIPFSYWMAFPKEMGVRGLWWGPTLATAYNTIWYNIIIYRINWYELIKNVKEREEAEKKLREELAAQQALELDDDYAKDNDTPKQIN